MFHVISVFLWTTVQEKKKSHVRVTAVLQHLGLEDAFLVDVKQALLFLLWINKLWVKHYFTLAIHGTYRKHRISDTSREKRAYVEKKHISPGYEQVSGLRFGSSESM